MTDDRLVDFVALLRQNGLRVSPGETVDAAKAIGLVPLEDRGLVRAALSATLVKRGADAALFDRLFDLYFGAIGRLLEGLEETLAKGLSMEGLSLEEMQAIADELASLGARNVLASAVAQGQVGEIARLMRAAAIRVDFSGLGNSLQRGFYARRVMAQAGIPELSREFALLEKALAERGIDPRIIERVSSRLNEAVEALEETARRVSDTEQKARDRESTLRGPDAMLQRTISTLNAQELLRMREVVRRLAEKLKSRLARQRRQRKRGQLHVRRTLRKNLSWGGVPMKLAFRQRRPERPDLVMLCDVSDSVRNVSRLMLQFVYTLQEQYARVRSFVFVSDLGEVTSHFKEARVEEAVDGAIAAKVINLSANSNYGHAFRQFYDDFRGAITRRTTLLLIGDGRSNYNPANAWVLDDLKRKARRVLWLCPEDQNAWGFGDSEMNSYSRFCDRVFVVRSVDDLSHAVEALVPRGG
jgi:uncharacterized protein with von Willebrand factor type A (vWA) domain